MNEEMKIAWLEISDMLGEPTRKELDVFLRTWQRASQATRKALAEQPAQQDSTCSNALRIQGKAYPRTCKKCGLGPCIADRVQPAQQEPTVSKATYNRLRDDYNDLVNRSEQDAKDAKEWRAHVNRCKLAGVDLDYQTTTPQAQPAQQEPVAWMFQHEETGRTMCVDAQQVEWGFEKGNPRLKKIALLYTSPPAQRTWVGLTDAEVMEIAFNFDVPSLVVRTVEAKLRIKNEDRN